MDRPIKVALWVLICALGADNASAVDWKGALGGLADKASGIKAQIDQKNENKAPAGESEQHRSGTGGAQGAPSYKAYQNYDFVPGEKIVFEDDFAADNDGEFPAHWKLERGQGAVNRLENRPAMALTEGNYARVEPRVRQAAYLSNPFTIEFDFYPLAGGYESLIVFLESGDSEADVIFGKEVSSTYFKEDSANQSAHYPGSEEFTNRWHHAALVFKNGQIKAYLDQYRVLVLPDVGDFKPAAVQFGGIGGSEQPLIFTNVRIANGGGMNLTEQLTKDGRLVTHGILFDVGQSVVKPESMGTLRQILAAFKADPALKVEIGGHTDADGDAARNLTLSQARADAVKKVLVDQGVDASRLTTKGYGATKPIDSNSTPEGKANNRRVEFVKQ